MSSGRLHFVSQELEEIIPVTEASIFLSWVSIQVLARVSVSPCSRLCFVQRLLGLPAGECARMLRSLSFLRLSGFIKIAVGEPALGTAEDTRLGKAATTCCPHHPF